MLNNYDELFYRDLRVRARRSASVVAPLVLEWIQPRSVVDVGCGVGTWLSVFRELGVEDVLGVDGAHVNHDLLEIPRERFRPFDLRQPLRIERTFDLAISVEVAEHLPSECAAQFVASLTALGKVVLFSAAIPFQGGTHHVNEQWPEYWAELFAAAGYVALDCLRPRLWQDPQVEWFYAQNLLLFVERDHLETLPRLRRARPEALRDAASPLPLVHPQKYLETIEWNERVHQTMLEVGEMIPPEETFIFADEDQFGGLMRAMRRAIPFPEQNGYYGGPPADGPAALREFERLRRSDARFLVFAWPAFWWLDYYTELSEHLQRHFRCVLKNERVVVFDLRTLP